MKEDATLAATIVIPTHNHGPTLRASVASVLRQTVPDIDDGSDPTTRKVD